MPCIPDHINGVKIEFADSVKNSVDQKVVDALQFIISEDVATGYVFTSAYISSANDQHEYPSRHVQGEGKAVDISRINGMKMSLFYSKNASVKAITNALQNKYEGYEHKRENFGPSFKKKLGLPHTVSGHADHIHISVN
ncbi:MAG TPA: hypothetical protein DDW29_17055 [Gammaproteobacteria bacterium]|nr:hypothetical protein [Gammaproteobacteria bacterium]